MDNIKREWVFENVLATSINRDSNCMLRNEIIYSVPGPGRGMLPHPQVTFFLNVLTRLMLCKKVRDAVANPVPLGRVKNDDWFVFS
jgi:hypothetical protein